MRIWAIAKLTFAEGVRLRIVVVFLLVLGFVMLRLPFALRGDETLSGRLQTFLSYSLGALNVFMSLATIFFSCTTLSKEITSRSLHMVLSKPVARFDVLLGKWIGVNLLNLMMVIAAGLVIYAFAAYIKTRPETFSRDRTKLNDVIWTARIAASPKEPDVDKKLDSEVDQMIREGRITEGQRDGAKRDRYRQFRESWMQVPPGDIRTYEFDDLPAPEDPKRALQVRFKARAIPRPIDDLANINWAIINPENGAILDTTQTQEKGDEYHEFLLTSAAIRDGKLMLAVQNPFDQEGVVSRRRTIYFEGTAPLQVLYRVGPFEVNYVKTLTIVLVRLAFLSALGIFFSTFVSFPVACFCVLTLATLAIGAPWWLESIGANLEGAAGTTADPFGKWGVFVRSFLVPVLTVVLPDLSKYDGVERLIEGVYIEPALLIQAALHTLVYGLVLLLLPGWLIFKAREVALPTA